MAVIQSMHYCSMFSMHIKHISLYFCVRFPCYCRFIKSFVVRYFNSAHSSSQMVEFAFLDHEKKVSPIARLLKTGVLDQPITGECLD